MEYTPETIPALRLTPGRTLVVDDKEVVLGEVLVKLGKDGQFDQVLAYEELAMERFEFAPADPVQVRPDRLRTMVLAVEAHVELSVFDFDGADSIEPFGAPASGYMLAGMHAAMHGQVPANPPPGWPLDQPWTPEPTPARNFAKAMAWLALAGDWAEAHPTIDPQERSRLIVPPSGIVLPGQ